MTINMAGFDYNYTQKEVEAFCKALRRHELSLTNGKMPKGVQQIRVELIITADPRELQKRKV